MYNIDICHIHVYRYVKHVMPDILRVKPLTLLVLTWYFAARNAECVYIGTKIQYALHTCDLCLRNGQEMAAVPSFIALRNSILCNCNGLNTANIAYDHKLWCITVTSSVFAKAKWVLLTKKFSFIKKILNTNKFWTESWFRRITELVLVYFCLYIYTEIHMQNLYVIKDENISLYFLRVKVGSIITLSDYCHFFLYCAPFSRDTVQNDYLQFIDYHVICLILSYLRTVWSLKNSSVVCWIVLLHVVWLIAIETGWLCVWQLWSE